MRWRGRDEAEIVTVRHGLSPWDVQTGCLREAGFFVPENAAAKVEFHPRPNADTAAKRPFLSAGGLILSVGD
jgi:hypothetical protein